jgi:hypothetical protein
MKKSLLSGVAVATVGGLAVLPTGSANAAICTTLASTGFPTNSTGCNELITINANGSITTSIPTGATTNYDGVEDNVLGVVNNSSSTIFALNLKGSNIFGFDGDGIQSFLGLKANSKDTSGSGYGGPLGFFTNLKGTNTGTVNFIGGIAPGASTYFSLEEPATLNTTVTPAPEPATLATLGAGLVGFGLLRRRRRK